MTGVLPNLYAPTSGAAPVSPAFAAWDSTTSSARFAALTTGTSNTNNRTITKNLASVHTALNMQLVGPVLPANVNMAGTFTANHQSSSTGGGAHNLRMVIKVVSGDGTTLRGILADVTGAVTINGAAITNTPFAAALASVNALAGDRIVVEIGPSYVNATAGGSATVRVGDSDNNWILLALNAYGPARNMAEGAEVLSTRTANPSLLSAAGMEVLSTRTANPAFMSTIGMEILSPVGYVVSAHDGATAIEQLHTDGVWRRMMALGAGA